MVNEPEKQHTANQEKADPLGYGKTEQEPAFRIIAEAFQDKTDWGIEEYVPAKTMAPAIPVDIKQQNSGNQQHQKGFKSLYRKQGYMIRCKKRASIDDGKRSIVGHSIAASYPCAADPAKAMG